MRNLVPNRWLACLLIACLFSLPIGLVDYSYLDGHEVLVAQTAREMSARNDWLTPTLGGKIRLEKPPLAYYLARVTQSFFGADSIFAARLPALLAGLFSALLLYTHIKRALGPRAGLWSAIVQLTSVWVILFARNAQIDMILTLLCHLAIVFASPEFFSRHSSTSREPNRSWRWCFKVIGFWIAMGLAVLAKGPVALGIVLPTVLVARWLCWNSKIKKPQLEIAHSPVRFWSAMTMGVAVFLLLSFAWPILVAAEHPNAWQIWRAQSVDRFVDRFGPQTRGVLFYPYIILVWTLPWSPILIICLADRLFRTFRKGLWAMRLSPSTSAESLRRLYLTWLVLGTLFFSLSAGKREHYILPILPACSALVGIYLARDHRALVNLLKRWQLRHGHRDLLKHASWRIWLLGSVSRLERACAVGVVVALLASGVAFGLIMPMTKENRPLMAMLDRQRSTLQSGPPIMQIGKRDRSILFPINRPIEWAEDWPHAKLLLADRTWLILVRGDASVLLTDQQVQLLDHTAVPKDDSSLLGQLIPPGSEEPWSLVRWHPAREPVLMGN